MRFAASLAVFLILVSCGPPAVLVTDDLFRSAAPEIPKAWESLRPVRDARTLFVGRDPGLPAVLAALKPLPPGTSVLVGTSLNPGDRQALAAACPKLLLTFFSPDGITGGVRTITVDRLTARDLVARAAAVDKSPAAAWFPAGTDPAETARFEKVWQEAGGGSLDVTSGPRTAPWGSGLGQVFFWQDDGTEPPVPPVPPGTAVHGNPGLTRGPGSGGWEWSVKEAGLGEFLWNTATSKEKMNYFLPLETVLIRR